MANKVKFGLKNVHIAKITYGTGTSGVPTITYATPFVLPGAVSITLDAEGESADFYADNTKYFNAFSNQGYSGSLEIAMINDKFRTDILGEVTDSKGAFVESKDDTISDFALGFEIDGDQVGRKFWYYNVSASRPSNTSSTTETSKSPVTDTLNITATARITDGKVRVFMEETSTNKTDFASFFEDVYEPSISA